MKFLPLTATLLLTAFPGVVFADAKDDVKAAVDKLTAAENYSWSTQVDMGADSQFRPGPIEGKALKDGTAMVTWKRGDNTTEAFVKDGKAVMKVEGAWKTPEELAAASEGEGGGRGRMMGGMLRNTKAPAAQAADLAGKVEKLEEKDGALTGTLSGETLNNLLTFGGRRRDGSAPPAPKDASGTIKFWVRDGVLTKMETHVKGTMSWNGEDRPIDRKTTTEISAVGSTKLEVPEEVSKKLAAGGEAKK